MPCEELELKIYPLRCFISSAGSPSPCIIQPRRRFHLHATRSAVREEISPQAAETVARPGEARGRAESVDGDKWVT